MDRCYRMPSTGNTRNDISILNGSIYEKYEERLKWIKQKKPLIHLYNRKIKSV